MRYENPLPPEVNVSKRHPLIELAVLLVGAVFLIMLIIWGAHLFSEQLGRFVPFSWEQKVADQMAEQFPKQTADIETERYLQQLALTLKQQTDFPEDVPLQVHYVEDNTVNAFTTLGGHIVIFKGLLNKLESENALFFILAHEAAHVQQRHPLTSLGKGAITTLIYAMLFGTDGGPVGDIFESTGLLTILKFNRDQETEADTLARQYTQQRYGHLNGAGEFFINVNDKTSGFNQFEFFRSHPLSKKRLEALRSTSSNKGETTPLPDFITHPK